MQIRIPPIPSNLNMSNNFSGDPMLLMSLREHRDKIT